MRTIIRRLHRLEQRVADRDADGPSWVQVLIEKQRRRVEAKGLSYEEPWRDPKLYENGRRPSWAEVLQSLQARRAVRRAARQ